MNVHSFSKLSYPPFRRYNITVLMFFSHSIRLSIYVRLEKHCSNFHASTSPLSLMRDKISQGTHFTHHCGLSTFGSLCSILWSGLMARCLVWLLYMLCELASAVKCWPTLLGIHGYTIRVYFVRVFLFLLRHFKKVLLFAGGYNT